MWFPCCLCGSMARTYTKRTKPSRFNPNTTTTSSRRLIRDGVKQVTKECRIWPQDCIITLRRLPDRDLLGQLSFLRHTGAILVASASRVTDVPQQRHVPRLSDGVDGTKRAFVRLHALLHSSAAWCAARGSDRPRRVWLASEASADRLLAALDELRLTVL